MLKGLAHHGQLRRIGDRVFGRPLGSLHTSATTEKSPTLGFTVIQQSQVAIGLSGRRLNPGLDLPPECIDAVVPLVRYLLEGLVGLLLHGFEPGVGDQLGDGAAQ